MRKVILLSWEGACRETVGENLNRGGSIEVSLVASSDKDSLSLQAFDCSLCFLKPHQEQASEAVASDLASKETPLNNDPHLEE